MAPVREIFQYYLKRFYIKRINVKQRKSKTVRLNMLRLYRQKKLIRIYPFKIKPALKTIIFENDCTVCQKHRKATSKVQSIEK